MALKKQHFVEVEIPIFDDACIYMRGEYWWLRMWLPKENKYARQSLRTRSEANAIEKGKTSYLKIYVNLQQGRTYFSINTKKGVEKYLNSVCETLNLDTEQQTSHLFPRNHCYQINTTTEINAKNTSKVHGLWLFTCAVDIVNDWHSEA